MELFRAEQTRTNNVCEIYNRKKGCGKPHLSMFEMIMILQKEYKHYEMTYLQVENRRQPLSKQTKT